MKNIDIRTAKSSQDMALCFSIRRTVFVEGQNVDEHLDQDGLDADCCHFLLYAHDVPCATARMRSVDSRLKIERMAVLPEYRGQGLGKNLLLYILAYCQAHFAGNAICLDAQCHAIQFYEKLGFKVVGDVFMDAGMAHVKMILKNRPAA